MQSIEVCSRHSHVNVIHSDILVLDKDFSRLDASDRNIFVNSRTSMPPTALHKTPFIVLGIVWVKFHRIRCIILPWHLDVGPGTIRLRGARWSEEKSLVKDAGN